MCNFFPRPPKIIWYFVTRGNVTYCMMHCAPDRAITGHRTLTSTFLALCHLQTPDVSDLLATIRLPSLLHFYEIKIYLSVSLIQSLVYNINWYLNISTLGRLTYFHLLSSSPVSCPCPCCDPVLWCNVDFRF